MAWSFAFLVFVYLAGVLVSPYRLASAYRRAVIESLTERAYPNGRSSKLQKRKTYAEAAKMANYYYDKRQRVAWPEKPSDFMLSFITDIEGDLEWFEDIVSISDVLHFTVTDTVKRLDFKADGSFFVCGGDMFDRGSGDITVAKFLIDLKDRYPDRVFLIIGNRDANKLRLASELSDACLARTASECTHATFRDDARDEPGYAPSSRAERLKWLLKYTMGAPHAFRFRAEELQRSGANATTDDDVASSFLNEVMPPDGVVYRYLQRAAMAARVFDTLFVHGAFTPKAMNFVPSVHLSYGESAKGKKATNIMDREEIIQEDPMEGKNADIVREGIGQTRTLDEWLEASNRYVNEAMAEYALQPVWEEPHGHFGGESLVCMQSPPCCGSRTVISAAWNHVYVDDRKSLNYTTSLGDGVAQYLLNAGVRRVCTGHKPLGSFPLVSSIEGIEIVVADTSYSGDAFHEVIIDSRGSRVHGILENKTTMINFRPDQDRFTGRRTFDGWYVMAREGPVGPDARYHLMFKDGRKRTYRDNVTTSQVEAEMRPYKTALVHGRSREHMLEYLEPHYGYPRLRAIDDRIK